MKYLQLFLGFVLLVVPSFGPGASLGLKQPAIGQTGKTVNLPVVFGPALPAPTTIIQKIDRDVARGALSAEQGLTYKVFATFSDPRLPAQYASGSIGGDGDGVMMDVAARWNSLSASAQAAIRPFLIPPYQAGSWFKPAQSSPAGAQNIQSPADFWSTIVSANGKVRFYWPTGNAQGQALAAGLKEAMDDRIWDDLTEYMQKTPIMSADGTLPVIVWRNYFDTDGTAVPYDAGTGGVTVRPSCSHAAGIIYIPINRNLGDDVTPGAIQSLAHEFMHTLQYTYTIGDCDAYKWLREGTAKWSEDYVYPAANSEHPRAIDYLSQPNLRLDDPSYNTRYYGTWVLFYDITYELGNMDYVRLVWEQAEKTNNSFAAIYNAEPENERDAFWSRVLPALWNQAPYDTFLKDNDTLTDTVKAESPNPIPVALSNGYFTYPLGDDLKTGAARFYHFTFSDASVRSFSVLNGIGKDLTKGDAQDNGNWDTTTGDQVYVSNDLSDADAAGADVILMLKADGQDWRSYPLGNNMMEQSAYSYCFDSQTKITDMVVIQSNSDWLHPDRVITHQDEPTTVVANDMPCWGLQGTAKTINFSYGSNGAAGVTLEFDSTVTFGGPDGMYYNPGVYENNPLAYPEVSLPLASLHTDWTISGNDGQCAYSGSGSFDQGPDISAGSEAAYLFSGVLPGGPSYRGYEGTAGLEADPYPSITYQVTGKNCPGTVKAEIGWSIEIPIVDNRANIKVPTGGNTLSGSSKRDGESVGHYEQFEWNLTPVTQ